VKRIVIEAITPEQARLPAYSVMGCGDWWRENGTLNIRVVGDDLDEEGFLIALHELVEERLCAIAGVPQQEVDDFDAQFCGDGEPGDDIAAPYREQHRKAMIIEHLMAVFMGIKGYGRIE